MMERKKIFFLTIWLTLILLFLTIALTLLMMRNPKVVIFNEETIYVTEPSQHYHQHQQRSNNVQHSMHTNRSNYHSAQTVSNGVGNQYKFVNLPKPSYDMQKQQQQQQQPQSFGASYKDDTSQSQTFQSQNVENSDENSFESDEKYPRKNMVYTTIRVNECEEQQNVTGSNESQTANKNKTKTPMCLVNELVRYNSLKHQYRLANEEGPAHNKEFTIILELGDEEYKANYRTVKGAQHIAAAKALEKTKYPRPVARQRETRSISSRPRNIKYGTSNILTPTVELNALAMKRGLLTDYTFHIPKSYKELAENTGNNSRNITNNVSNPNALPLIQQNRVNNNRKANYVPHRTTEDDPYKVTVKVGNLKFTGIGLTLQAAKHKAASKALAEMTGVTTKALENSVESSNSVDVVENPNIEITDLADTDNLDANKSAISMIQEIAQKRDLLIRFLVESEIGPAHMKHFVIKCTVGDLNTIGEGNSKKVAKKHSAEAMLIELKKLPPIKPRPVAQSASNVRRNNRISKRSISNSQTQVQSVGTRRKPRNLIKDILPNGNGEYESVETELTNPISQLLRIQQAAKKREPIYSVIEERRQQKRKEFVIEVDCSGEKVLGAGPNKKQAKRVAAQNFLVKLGYTKEELSEVPVAGQKTKTNEKVRKVTFKASEEFLESTKATSPVGGSAGRQLVPGVLIMKSPESKSFTASTQSGINNQTTAAIAKELLDAGTSPTAEAMVNQNSPKEAKQETTIEQIESSEASSIVDKSVTANATLEIDNSNLSESTSNTQSHDRGIRPTNQLLYLADLLKFEVQFNDFPKGNHNDYLTLVSLTTDPPQIFHGSGNSLDASKDQAALSALTALSQLGLDNVNKAKRQQSPPKSILSNGKSN